MKLSRNIDVKANMIWNIADTLRDVYKRHQYGSVILPFVVIKRFDAVLQDTKEKVYETYKQVKDFDDHKVLLKRASGHGFYNCSRYTLGLILSDADNIESNFNDYVNGFSEEVQDILSNFEMHKLIEKLASNNLLYNVLQEVNKVDLHPETVSNIEMGYIFEETIRRFSEAQNEEAGEHYTPREVIELMVNILFTDEDLSKTTEAITKTIYDPACGTGGMLTVAEKHLRKQNSSYNLISYGQEINSETYAICKADILIKGEDADFIRHGNTLSNDRFKGYNFDYIISNPPFGKDWKSDQKKVKEEEKLGAAGRFHMGLPSVSDGQMLFLQTAVAKMKDKNKGGSRVAIIHNGSPLFTGDAESGPSKIRQYIIENDMLDTIIALPNDIFYNTGIATYLWVLSNKKPAHRKGKVQLINANDMFEKMRKSLGKKNKEITPKQIEYISKIYGEFKPGEFEYNGNIIESKIFDNQDFGYLKVTVERPLKDKKGELILKRGKKQPDSNLRDTENIPLKEDVKEYMEREVLPYAPDAWIDKKKTKVGYEIPFTRYFYKYIPPRKSDDIFSEIKELEDKELQLMKELFGNG
ncbi:SAM-dependent DNA methyltransferase [Hujiaoplasma nucleasis]|uniref:site-specific DNA-methyltransferase (adenine-specific) n=1 Tax=Hujiaoplasma nucleasis TaxID=2725268 RepID=A0A7L6N2D9_9MOLU|nr:class I SAM-dependent DNA methyltransferase [Hujiaoplasma nucleasis]QLY39388.1 SAM-dependent DNA methyltransferase [Hujiaoplasma nucleasis]